MAIVRSQSVTTGQVGPLAQWRFDEAGGGTALDRSGGLGRHVSWRRDLPRACGRTGSSDLPGYVTKDPANAPTLADQSLVADGNLGLT